MRPRALLARRAFILLLTLAMTGIAADQMYRVLAVSTLTVLEAIVLVLFVILFAWIAFSVRKRARWFRRCRCSDATTPSTSIRMARCLALTGRHALLAPTYNETRAG